MNKTRAAFLGVLWIGLSLPGYAAENVAIQAPDGEIGVTVSVTSEGRLCYAVERLTGGQTVILPPSPLGITVDGIDLGQGVKIGACQRESHDKRYTWRGVHAEAVNRCNGAEIAVTHVDSGTAYALEVRVFGDGMGYRYVVPGAGQRTIGGEASAWNLPDDCQIWYETDVKNYEGFYAKGSPSELEPDEPIGFPVTIEYADGTYGAITEAGVFAYSGMSLRTTGSTTLKGVFEDDEAWQETDEIRTPWRVTMTGPDLNALVNCDIVPNLCPAPDRELFPHRMDTEWTKPGRSLWNWWSDSPVEFQYQAEWVDKAAQMGFEYYLVDAGWEKTWQLPGKDKWACLEELCDYAQQKGIGINVWKFWGELAGAEARQDFFRRCAERGVVGVKIDFMDLESRERIDFYTDTLIDAAQAKLMINFHGANKPTGEPRTFPNEMTREGIRGLEYNKWSELPAVHYATLPFTRYLAGHGDFTPCTFHPGKLKGTTVTLQLASAIAFTSPLMHWADHWSLYLDSDALEVIKQIPSTWDETVVLPGSDIGQVAALARRKGGSWFVGVINGGQARMHALDLSFLDDRTYQAVMVRDVTGQPAEMTVEHTTAEKNQSLDVPMETGGGFVAWLTPGKKPLSWLHTEGNRIVDASGTARILRGVNRSGFEYNKQGNRMNQEEIEYICKEWKAQIIRIPFNQEWITNDPDYADLLDTVIGWISDCGAYALLDLQWENTTVKIPPIPNAEAVQMWRGVAQRYKDNPAVLYDLHNEAHDTTWQAWRERAIEMIEAIQQVHPQALIFVSGLDWAYDLRGWQKQPLPYENIVYSTHPYPFKGAPWAWDEYFGVFSESYPVFAGEFGGGQQNLDWGEKLLAYFDEKGLGWAAWSWVDMPKLTQQDRRTPTAFGKLVMEALQAHAAQQ